MIFYGSANCRALRHNFCSATEATKATGATMQEGGLVLWRYFFSGLSGLSGLSPSHPFRLSRPSYLFVAFRFLLSPFSFLLSPLPTKKQPPMTDGCLKISVVGLYDKELKEYERT